MVTTDSGMTIRGNCILRTMLSRAITDCTEFEVASEKNM